MKKLTADRIAINTIYEEVGRLEEETNKYATKSKDLTAKQATTAKLQVLYTLCISFTFTYIIYYSALI